MAINWPLDTHCCIIIINLHCYNLEAANLSACFILTISMTMTKKTIVIDGNNFCDLETFFTEIDRALTKNLNWKTGHNMNSFNDLLRGGFGVYEYEEPVQIIWINFNRSETCLGKEITNELKRFIRDHTHIDFNIQDELLPKFHRKLTYRT